MLHLPKISRKRPRDRRGSVLVLVVVAIVLMTLMGAAYLQVARVQRANVAERVEGDIDAVLESIIQKIELELTDDLMDESGTFFKAATANGGADEPYDKPWTNNSSTREATLLIAGTTTTTDAVGGQYDDTHLASSFPEFDGTNWYWPHITNLMGVYLHTGSDEVLTDAAQPTEVWVTNDSGDPKRQHDTSLYPGSHTFLYDADGDGYGDSRWAWAPIPQINGIAYTMAVRIIDTSSMVNVNVATGLVDGTGAHDDYEDAPRWLFPSDVDFCTFAGQLTGGSTAANEALSVINYRLNSSHTAWMVPLANRGTFWLDGARQSGSASAASTYNWLTMDDEYQLRYLGGLSDGDEQGELEQRMSTSLRSNTVDDFPPAAGSYSFENMYAQNLRPHLTTYSNTAVFAPAPTTAGMTQTNDGHLKLDLNLIDVNVATTRQRIQDVLSSGSFTPPSGLTVAQYAAQLTACMIDYADNDSTITHVGSQYGLEALPFIADVYYQRAYTTDAAGVTPNATSGFDVAWTSDGDVGFAVEIRNPFNRPISLKDIRLVLNNSGSDTVITNDLETYLQATLGNPLGTYNLTTYGATYSFSAATDPQARYLYPGDALVIYQNSTSTAGTDDDILTVIDVSGGDVVTAQIPDSTFAWPEEAGGSPTQQTMTVELRAPVNGGGTITYSSAQTLRAFEDFDEIGVTNDPGGETTVYGPRYYQRSAHGNGNGLNTLTLGPTEFLAAATLPSDNGSSARTLTTSKLGEDAKGASGSNKDKLTGVEQILIADRAAFGGGNMPFIHIGELAHIAAIGPTASTTVGEQWGAETTVTSFMLDLASGSDIVAGGGTNADLGVPYGVVLMEQFTTTAPQTDGEDNDGDGTADNGSGEWAVPGRINVNTASHEVLEHSIPLANGTMRTTLADAIIDYRNTPDDYGRDGDREGFAYGAELLSVAETALGLSSDGADNITIAGATPGTAPAAGVPKIDYLSNNSFDPSKAWTDPEMDKDIGDGIIDDREEYAMLGKWLMQVASARSDTYVAYIVVHGYDSTDFTAGPQEVLKAIVLFDRSSATAVGDTCRAQIWMLP